MRLFVSYSGHDHERKVRLLKFVRQELGPTVQIWDDHRLEAGPFEPQLLKELDAADAVLFLVSIDFLESDYCTRIELPRARAASPPKKLIPVMLRPCPQAHALNDLARVPRENRPLWDPEPTDADLVRVSAQIRELLGIATPSLTQGPTALAAVPERTIAFVHRPDLEERLDAMVLHGSAVLVGLAGGGGVGKTTLAINYARRHVGSGYDRVIWTDVRSRGGGTAQVAEEVLRALGEDVRPVVVYQVGLRRIRAVLEASARRQIRTLAVFDNVDHPDDDLASFIDAIASCDGCDVIVTTRDADFGKHLSSAQINIGDFQLDEAVACLRLRLKDGDPRRVDLIGLRAVAEHAARTPLWVQLAGTYLRRHGIALDAYVRGPGPFTAIRGALSAAEVLVFASCGACAATTFSVDAAAAASGLDVGDTHRILIALEAWSVVQIRRDGRVTLHPLLRERARAEASFDEAVERHARWVLNTIGTDEYALDSRDAIREEIAAVVENGAHVVDVCRRAWWYWHQRGPYALAIHALERAVAVARADGDDASNLSFVLFALARLEMRLGQWDRALELLAEKEQVDRARADSHEQARALQQWGYLLGLRGDVLLAQQKLAEALRLLETAPSSAASIRDCAITLGSLGVLARRSGQVEQAIDYAQRGLQLFEALHDDAEIATSLRNLGAANIAAGRPRDALALIQKALTLFRTCGIPEGVAASLNTEGEAHIELGDFTAAERCYGESLELSRTAGATRWIAENLHHLATIRIRQGDTSAARALLYEALPLFESMGQGDRVNECTQLLTKLEAR